MEKAQVESRFRSLFACPSPHVVSTGGGYRAEGCGVTAQFQCFESARAYDQRKQGLLGAALATDTCVIEHSERAPRPKAAPGVERARADDGGVRLKARALVRGGHLEAVAVPKQDREHVVISVHSIENLGEEPCASDLFRDGEAITVLQVSRASDHELRMAIRMEQLHELGKAERFAGRACGFEFDVDDHGRKALGLLEVRFREELARLSPAPASGGEAPGATP